jgi:hypothetical protein
MNTCRSSIPRLILATCTFFALCGIGTTLPAQKYFPTATKRADLQVGGGYAISSPDYSNQRFQGITGYATLDVTPHWGFEFDIHQVNTTGDDHIYERSYEIGPRYVRHYGRFNPYLRASYGRGVFNFPYNQANVAYNIAAGAIGLDVRIKPHLFVRGEYEGQYWFKFQDRSLQPDVTTIGAAYHF